MSSVARCSVRAAPSVAARRWPQLEGVLRGVPDEGALRLGGPRRGSPPWAGSGAVPRPWPRLLVVLRLLRRILGRIHGLHGRICRLGEVFQLQLTPVKCLSCCSSYLPCTDVMAGWMSNRFTYGLCRQRCRRQKNCAAEAEFKICNFMFVVCFHLGIDKEEGA